MSWPWAKRARLPEEAVGAAAPSGLDSTARPYLIGLPRTKRHRQSYQPLDPQKHEILVVSLLPKNTRYDPLHLTLHTVSLDDAPTYEAISYVWGDPTDTSEVLVDNVAMLVPKSLHWALVLFRETANGEVLSLWMDCVSIDQANVKERELQITLMTRIYRQASCVRAWLGASFAGNSLGAVWFRQLLTCGSAPDPQSECDVFVNSLLSVGHSETPADVLERLESLAKIFQLPYWRRKWIIQEVALGERLVLYYGYDDINLELTHESIETFQSLLQSLVGTFKRYRWPGLYGDVPVKQFYKLLIGVPPSPHTDARPGFASMVTLLVAAARSYKASDPRDHVYALMGLLPQHLVHRPDYTQSPSTVFEGGTRSIINSTWSLDILTQASFGMSGLHSWVVDFGSGVDGPPLVHSKRGTRASSGAALRLPGALQHPPRAGELNITALVLDMISTISTAPNPGFKTSPQRRFLCAIHERMAMFQELTSFGLEPQPDWNALWRTQIGSCGRSHGQQDAGNTEDHDFDARACDEITSDVLGFPVDEDEKDGTQIFETLRVNYKNFGFFTTTLGHIGTTAYSAQIGDVLVIPATSQVQFCVRAAEGRRRGVYKQVSKCLVHGVMYGEAVQAKADELSTERSYVNVDDVFEPMTLV